MTLTSAKGFEIPNTEFQTSDDEDFSKNEYRSFHKKAILSVPTSMMTLAMELSLEK